MNKKSFNALFLVVSLFAIDANAASMAYSINSDSGNIDAADSLYLIDLTTGIGQLRGKLISGFGVKLDTEGLAISPDGTLWGIDDDSLMLFPINTKNGAIGIQDEVSLTGFPAGGGNDFGMTFGCDNSLYITSVRTRTLYRLSLDGNSEVIGTVGALGQNISATAAFSNPTLLYGLGNGTFEDGSTDSPNLYSIDVNTGIATMIGPLGAEASDYDQAGLAFDGEGTLWAITDRRTINDKKAANLPSEILRIDIETGTATLVWTTTEIGFESLAIAPPAACSTGNAGGDFYPIIPTLSSAGRLLIVFIFLLAGMSVLRQRHA